MSLRPLPDIKAWNIANDYQISASLLNEKYGEGGDDAGYGWVACVSATAALEMYLRSFSAECGPPSLAAEEEFLKHEGMQLGDTLQGLYDSIPASFKLLIAETFRVMFPDRDLAQSLQQYKADIFDGRYRFQGISEQEFNNDIVFFAEEMRQVICRVIDIQQDEPSYF